MAELAWIAVPYWLGEKTAYTGSVEVVQQSGIGAGWVNVVPDGGADDHPVNHLNRAVATAVQRARAAGKIPFVIAGDCTVCLGSMKGLEADQTHVLWLDSHGDFNTPETTPSGFLGGMPLAAMVGRGNQHLMTGIGLSAVAEERIILTDGRDLDPEEGELVRESALTHYPNLRDLLEVDWTGKPLYIHFDCDIVCLDDLPAVSYPAQGGPTLAEMLDVLRAVTERADVRGVHVTCWNNQLAGAERSRDAVLAAIRVMAEALQA